MRRVYLAYSLPSPSGYLRKALNKVLLISSFFPPINRQEGLMNIDWPKPLAAPASIAYNLINALKSKSNLKLYDYRQRTFCKLEKSDILLFHPCAIMKDGHPISPDFNTIGLQSLIKNNVGNKYMIIPYNHDINQIEWLKPVLLKNKISGLIAITGKYWSESWNKSPLFNYVDNICFVEMGIDTEDYPLIKTEFNPPGKRKFLYIGKTGNIKNTSELENIAKNVPGFEGGYISNGKISGWKKISGFVDLTPKVVSKLAQEYDIFLNVSTFDAQATTILEQMCFGFPVACTQESGYSYKSIIRLDPYNTKFNCEQIKFIQNMPSVELLKLSIANRKIVKNNHNWDVFVKKITKFIKL